MKDRKFKVGDKVTYKSNHELPNHEYYFSGDDNGSFVGEIIEYYGYIASADCYKIVVTSKYDRHFFMLESEFVEYDAHENGSDFQISTSSEKPKLSFNF